MASEISENNYNSDSIGSCEEKSSLTKPTVYFQTHDLRFFVKQPLTMLYSYRNLKNECLSTGNPQAHYIEGILQYFQRRKTIKGLNHFRQSAYGNYDKGMYIYDILLLCRANFNEGNNNLDKLSWINNHIRSAQ